MIRNQFVCGSIQFALATCLIFFAGCGTMAFVGEQHTSKRVVETWGLARVRVETTKDSPTSVIIDVHLLDSAHYLNLQRAAVALAKFPGVVTVDFNISIHLPEEEGFQGAGQVNHVGYLAQGYDPALSMISDCYGTITIPLREEMARTAIVNGGKVTIDANRSERARSSLQGLAFQW